LAELSAYALIYETFERESDTSPMGQFLYRQPLGFDGGHAARDDDGQVPQ
jgi:hypothetical protein